MIATKSKVPAREFSRTMQRLQDARLALDQGHYTTTVILVRTAVDTAMFEAFGRSCDQGAFLNLLAIEAGGSPRTVKRIRRFRDAANAVIHGIRNAHRREARQMLSLFHAIGCRWVQRLPGGLPATVETEAAPEELTSV